MKPDNDKPSYHLFKHLLMTPIIKVVTLTCTLQTLHHIIIFRYVRKCLPLKFKRCGFRINQISKAHLSVNISINLLFLQILGKFNFFFSWEFSCKLL